MFKIPSSETQEQSVGTRKSQNQGDKSAKKKLEIIFIDFFAVFLTIVPSDCSWISEDILNLGYKFKCSLFVDREHIVMSIMISLFLHYRYRRRFPSYLKT